MKARQSHQGSRNQIRAREEVPHVGISSRCFLWLAAAVWVSTSWAQENKVNVWAGWDDSPAAERVRNLAVVRKYQCITCHTIGNQGGSIGPVLNQVGIRRKREWMLKWISDPPAIRPDTPMPKFEMTEAEREDLSDTLRAMAKPVETAEILRSTASPLEIGRRVFEAYDCYACHRIGDRGRFIGPDLTWIGFRKSETWERAWLANPDAFKPGTFMPDFHLSSAAATALAGYLETLQGQTHNNGRTWDNPFLSPIERGRQVFQRFGCNGCHGDGGKGGWPNPNAAGGVVTSLLGVREGYTEEELKEKIRQGAVPISEDITKPAPPFRMPAWGDRISQEEMGDLLSYLRSLRRPPAPGGPATNEDWGE